jgi:ABC-type antimicrobial peptide transport system permease subunit
VAHQRFQMLLVSAFSAMMLVLALVGTYGVAAYGVSERTNELGIRAALGATAVDNMRLVVGEGLRLAGWGVFLGLASVAALRGAMPRFVSTIGRLDVATLIAVPVLLAAATLVATLIPARRAARVDPMRALRSD